MLDDMSGDQSYYNVIKDKNLNLMVREKSGDH